MYNEELKLKFLDDYEVGRAKSTRIKFEGVLNKFAQYELEVGTDICFMDTDTIQKGVEKYCSPAMQTRKYEVGVLKKYCKWCMENGVHGAVDGISYIDMKKTQRAELEYVRSPLHLQSYLDILYTPESEETYDNVYRIYFWFAYAGIAESEVPNIKCGDVDFESMVINYDGEEYPIYREGLRALKICARNDSFVYHHPNYSKAILRQRVNGDYIMRGVKADISLNTLRVAISNKTKQAFNSGETNMKLTYKKVMTSGMFYRIYEREIAGITPNYISMADVIVKEKDYKITKLQKGGLTINGKRGEIARELEVNYNNWKATFKN